jgi:hypothetical protein
MGQGVLKLLHGGDVAFQVPLQLVVVSDDDALDQVVMDLVLPVGHVVGDLLLRALPVRVDPGGVGQEVGDAPEARLLADGQLQRGHPGAEDVAELVKRALEGGPFPVELVDEHQPG